MREHAELAKAPKFRDRLRRLAPRDAAGKLWSAPNTALGLAYGLTGYAAGQLNRLRPGDQPDPRIQMRNNAVEFVNNPFGGASAITLGNTITYNGDPYDPRDTFWYKNGENPQTFENGHSIMDHEREHTFQGQQLGPAYLPSNLLGGLWSLFRDGEWHGDSNWNERGPKADPPRPWASRKPE